MKIAGVEGVLGILLVSGFMIGTEGSLMVLVRSTGGTYLAHAQLPVVRVLLWL